jgi:hypothetical protein
MSTLKDDKKKGVLSPEDARDKRFVEEYPWCKAADPG